MLKVALWYFESAAECGGLSGAARKPKFTAGLRAEVVTEETTGGAARRELSSLTESLSG